MDSRGQDDKRGKITFDDISSSNWLEDEKTWKELQSELDNSETKSKRGPFGRKKNSAFDGNNNSEQVEKVELNIKFALPGFLSPSKIKPKLSSLKANRKYAYAFVSAMALLVVGYLGYSHINKDVKEVAGASSGLNVTTEPTHDPTFDLVVPKGRDIKKEEIFFDPSRTFAKYDDNINGVDISVSQQPVPEIYRTNPADGVAKIAQDYGAKELLTFEDVDMYYGQDVQGPQTLILTKNNIMIFILTHRAVDKAALQTYAANLD